MPVKRRRTIVHSSGRASVVEDSDNDEVEVSSMDELMSSVFAMSSTGPTVMSTAFTSTAMSSGLAPIQRSLSPPGRSSAVPAVERKLSPAGRSSSIPPSAAVVSAVETTKLTTPELEEIPTLVLVELHKNDIVAVVRALKKLYNLLKSEHDNSQKHKRDATLMGAAGAIVRAMRKWQWDQVIQVRGCNCLRRLSCEHIDGVCAIAQSGGVEATIDAMNAFPRCPYVQNRAVGVLQNTLSVSMNHPSVLAVTLRFVRVLNGLQLVLRAMKKFPDDAEVQADCCALFHNLALEEEMKEVMARAGVVSTVALTLERHYDNAEVKVEVESFMAEMFCKKEQGKGIG